MRVHQLIAAFAAAGLCAAALAASPGAEEIARLGKDLSAVGAERAGNKDGTIPPLTGSQPAPAGWTWGKQQRGDVWAHRADKPLFTIDAGNVDKYADKLTAGQVQALRQIKGYSMSVYPTRRECGVPEFVAQNTKDGATKASIGKDGWSLENAQLPGVPFPLPKSGIEVVWNWLMRYQGIGAEWLEGIEYVSPRPGSTTPINVRFNQIYYYPWAKPGKNGPQDDKGLQSGLYYGYSEPAALAGQGIAQRFYYAKDSDSFYYFTGQRRVRRLPAYAYDAPLIGYENQYPADSSFVFFGNPDRFEWKLVGKREVYVPYNGYAMQGFNTKLAEAAGPTSVNPALRRYELHRVWEVEGTVKSGVRHSTPKKTLFVDEDSWLVLLGDDYDAQGKIWKQKENYVAPQWEIGACTPIAGVFNDLISGRYLIDQAVIGTGKDIRYFAPGSKDARLNDGYYTAENLGAISDR